MDEEADEEDERVQFESFETRGRPEGSAGRNWCPPDWSRMISESLTAEHMESRWLPAPAPAAATAAGS